MATQESVLDCAQLNTRKSGVEQTSLKETRERVKDGQNDTYYMDAIRTLECHDVALLTLN